MKLAGSTPELALRRNSANVSARLTSGVEQTAKSKDDRRVPLLMIKRTSGGLANM
jgi:hypothetical protein